MQDETGQARLVYLISWPRRQQGTEPPLVMIDAQTGSSELKTLGGINHKDATGLGQRQDWQVFLRRRLWPLQVG